MARGGKNKKKGPPDSQKVISKFHALKKQIINEKDPKAKKALIEQEKAMSLSSYQDASKQGATIGGQTGSSKFLISNIVKLRDKKRIKILDVGSIDGTAYAKWEHSLVDVTSIDINSRSEKVIQADVGLQLLYLYLG